jgi:secretion/DNA translocation related CpaE-like protein
MAADLPRTAHPAPTLLASHDDVLVDTVLRLAAAAGVEVERTSDPGAAVARWGAAGSIVVGSDVLPLLTRLRPHRRSGVVVAVSGGADESVLRWALEIGADHVAEFPGAEPWLMDRLADLADDGSPGGQVWGVIGGTGGVGASTLAAAVAVVAAGSGPTALLDLDPAGSGVEQALGGDSDGVRWSDLHAAPGRLTARALREGLPRRDGLAVLGFGGETGPVDPAVVGEVLTAARRGHDVVVLDLPRWADESARSVLPSTDRVALLCAATVPGVSGARRVLERLPSREAVELVVRTRSRSAAPDDVAAALGFSRFLVLGEDRGLGERLDLGLGPCHRRRSPLTRAARELVEVMGGRP